MRPPQTTACPSAVNYKHPVLPLALRKAGVKWSIPVPVNVPCTVAAGNDCWLVLSPNCALTFSGMSGSVSLIQGKTTQGPVLTI